MQLELFQILAAGLIVAGAAFVQGTVGFAFGLFAIPSLTLVGLPLQHAVAIATGAVAIQSGWASWHLREHIPWGAANPAIIVRIVFMLAGVWMLSHLLAPDPTLAKQVLAGVLLVVVMVLWLCKVQPRERLHPLWATFVFPLSGLMGGLFGMSGPPLVLWAMSHRWPGKRTRAFLLVNFFATTPFQMGAMWLMFPAEIGWLLLVGLAFGPVVLGATHLGLHVGHSFSERRLRTAAFVLLVIIALQAMLWPWFTRGSAPPSSPSAGAGVVR